MKKPLLWVLILVMSISLVVVFSSGGCRCEAPPVEEATTKCKIAFISERDGNDEIYIMNVDGSGQTRLTNNLAYDGEPCFSPDGSKIAFTSYRDGNDEIYIMNVDGSGQVNLTNNTAGDVKPCFSP